MELSLGKKDESQIPTEKVLQFRSQGLSNDQIVSYLQREGYKSNQIFEAFTQADLKKQLSAGNLNQQMPLENPMPMPGIISSGTRKSNIDSSQIQEIAEQIIDEKWDELVENINKIVEWKEHIEMELNAIKSRQDSLNEMILNVQKSMTARVEDYDKTMTEVGTDVKALTMVFQKILPGFMENVSELSKIADTMKSEKSEKKAEIKKEVSKKTKSDDIWEEEDKSIEDIE